LGAAKAVLTLDNGILHLAAATTTPTVGLYRYGIHRLWAPPAPNLTVLTSGDGRRVADIEPDVVVRALA
jgi:ADP-heptose:LPS heptosyltransferase